MENENILLIDETEANTDENIEIIENEENTENVVTITETVTEYVYIKENRPLFDTPLSDYSVTEGLLLLILVITVLNNVFKSHIRG